MAPSRQFKVNETADACEQVIAALDQQSEWQLLRDALAHGKGYVPWLAMDQSSAVSAIHWQEGNGQQFPDDMDGPRDFQSVVENMLNPMIKRGEIEDGSKPGSFDDRKLRWANQSISDLLSQGNSTLTLKVAPTCFQHCQRDIHRPAVEALERMLAGIQAHNDPYIYFARGIGVVAIPLTCSGHACIGRRSHTSEYVDYLAFASGWATYAGRVEDIDIYRDVERELAEELVLQRPPTREQIRFAGLAGEPTTGETDLIFTASTGLDDDHFETRKFPEHSQWFLLKCRSEAEQLLEEGRMNGVDSPCSLMFSAQAGLEYLIHNHWRS